jgi:transposase
MEWTVAIGVDTHKEAHVAVALDALGAQLDSREIAATPAGYRGLLSWSQALGVPAFAVEGAGSYGAGLARFLERADVAVYECERPRRQERRRGKSDLVDAALAARRLLARERLSLPRGGGRREDLRLLLLERRSAMQARTILVGGSCYSCPTWSGEGSWASSSSRLRLGSPAPRAPNRDSSLRSRS